MPLINAWSLPPPPRWQFSKEFSHPEYPGVVVELTLGELGQVEKSHVRARQREYIVRHVTGKDGHEPNCLPVERAEGEGPIFLTEELVENLTSLEAMQYPAPEAERYDFLGLAGILIRLPRIWEMILVAVAEYLGKELREDAEGNSSAALESSGPPSDTGEPIPASDSTPPLADGLPTSDLEHCAAG